MPAAAKTNIKASVLWSLANQWGSRLIGLINILILARLLSPIDFGIIAMIGVVIGLIESMTQIGTHLYVFRTSNADERLYSSAWTINVIQGALIAVAMVFLAPYFALYFEQEKLIYAIYAMSLVKLIGGFNNYGVFIAQKKLNFKLDFAVTMISRWSFLIVSVIFAIIFENFWAIVFGQIAAAIFGLIASYVLHPFRPTFSFYDYKGILKYSYSAIPMSIGRFISAQIDKVALGRLASTEYLGFYQVSSGLASMFTRELLMPIIRGMLPNLSAIRYSSDFQHIFLLTITFAFYISLPMATGMYFLSEEILYVVAGEKWIAGADIMKWLAFYGFIVGILGLCSEQVFMIMEQEKLANVLIWIRNIFLGLAIFISATYFSIENIPLALMLSMLCLFPFVLWKTASITQIKMSEFITSWIPPVIGCIGMGAVLYWLNQLILVNNLYLNTILKCGLGGLFYLGTIIIIFFLKGKPEKSIESMVLKRFMKTKKP